MGMKKIRGIEFREKKKKEKKKSFPCSICEVKNKYK